MSIKFQSDSAGTGVFTVKTPASNSNRTLTLPDTTTTLVGEGTMLTTMTAKAYNWNGLTTNTVLDFTDIPSWVKRITVIINGISTNGTSVPIIQLGTGGVPTTSGYYATAAGIAATSVASAAFTTGHAIMQSFAATGLLPTGNIIFHKQVNNTWVGSGIVAYNNANGSSAMSGSSISLAGTLDMLRITTVNGTDTFDAGTVNVMYEG